MSTQSLGSCNIGAPQQERQVPLEIGQLSNLVEEAMGRLEALATRLSPVLEPGPICKSDEAMKETSTCPLASSIRGIKKRVGQIINLTNETINALEI